MTRTLLPYVFVFAMGYTAGVFVPGWVMGPAERATVVAKAEGEGEEQGFPGWRGGTGRTGEAGWRENYSDRVRFARRETPQERQGGRRDGDLRRLASPDAGRGGLVPRYDPARPAPYPQVSDRVPPDDDAEETPPMDAVGALLTEGRQQQVREPSETGGLTEDSVPLPIAAPGRGQRQVALGGAGVGRTEGVRAVRRAGGAGGAGGGRVADASKYAIDPSSVIEEFAYGEEEDVDDTDEGYMAPSADSAASSSSAADRMTETTDVGSDTGTAAGGAGQVSTAAALARLGGDVARGKIGAKACAVCHSFRKGEKSKLGPNLYGLLGRKVGGDRNFKKYSPALRNHGGTWTVELLDCYLKKPKKCIPGSNMAFGGLANKKMRTDVMSYVLSVTARETSDNPS